MQFSSVCARFLELSWQGVPKAMLTGVAGNTRKKTIARYSVHVFKCQHR